MLRTPSSTPPWRSIVFAEAMLSTSQMISTRSRPSTRASSSIRPSAEVASRRRRAVGRMPWPIRTSRAGPGRRAPGPDSPGDAGHDPR
ncbi:MAG TPA: hypothetical protein VG253_04210 [Streptosporangiaceae bacterium]|nr:hypothetical protein [Streptosporangiaceae bacterium]